ncbi:uncharacterized protein LOC129910759 [Episyrphus balteatus]|uniref:uncharacterized protein LOC129910759 n=1 Tax=Episyrphus balteatus TaxID=286459 RepID=UPI0024863DDD|nr:uncharacterized protein LOC129910759 [Episyrphus balteatus]XP_055844242.1 uncharacterized protein LOC129910759 [Episyrphus balteatus]
MHGTIIVVLIACVVVQTLTADFNFKWRTPQKEALDEINDRELLKAVQDSVKEWELNRKTNHRKKRAVKRVCYNDVGCFDDSGPFSYLEMLPASPEEINTSFYFYSTKNRSEQPLMEIPFVNMTSMFAKQNQTSQNVTTETTTPLTKSSFTLDDLRGLDELSIRVIVHGFGSACPHVWIYEMKTALMAVEDCIVICVDWASGSTFPNYVKAAANTRLVGKQVAMLINNLKEYNGLDLAKTHLIGFSLGAHVSGFAGAELPGLSRITGLDPAGPLFEAQHPKVRLDSTDATFVDVIHSNGENLILGGLGSWQPMGDVDFYPNGGRVQNGCSNLFVGAVTDFIWSQNVEDEEGRSLCNHRRAYKFFIDSVAPRCQFPAFPCNSYDNFLSGNCFPCSKYETNATSNGAKCGNMGYYADRSTGRGQLYLVTREEEPFCAHQFQIQIFNSFNDLPLRTIGRIEATLEGEGGLNETFRISEKEDTEFFAGDIVSKIIVPHPALGFPTSLSLQYKSYSGWLSKGLPHWDIDKIVLTDSFGRSHSYCKPQVKLTSGTPVHFKLVPGNCEIPNEEDYGTYITEDTTEKVSTEGPHDGDAVEAIKRRKDEVILKALTEINRTEKLNETTEGPWHSIFEGNSLDKEATETSRSLSEIFEPILKDPRSVVSSGRKMQSDDVLDEIVEPLLRSTTPRQRIKTSTDGSRSHKDLVVNTPETLTVQLLPFKLSELLERAERYARETLLPLISIQAPKFFNLGFKEEEGRDERKPRYIPRIEEEKFRRELNTTHAVRKQSSQVYNLVPAETETHRNIFDFMRPMQNKESTQSSNEVSYYANDLTESRALKPLDEVRELVHIDLPTYRPTVRKTSDRRRSLQRN